MTLRRLPIACAIVVALLAAGLVMFTSTDAGREIVRREAIRRLQDAGVRIDVARLDALGPRTVVLTGVRLDTDGVRIDAPRVTATVAIQAALGGELRLSSARLDDLRIRIRPITRAASATTASLPSLAIDRLTIRNGRVAMARPDDPSRHVAVDGLDADASASVIPARLRLAVDRLQGRTRGLALGDIDVRGAIEYGTDGALVLESIRLATARSTLFGQAHIGDTVVADLRADPLGRGDVRAFVPAIRLATDVDVTLSLRGPANAVGLVGVVRAPDGAVIDARGMLDLTAPRPSGRVRVDVANVDLGTLWEGGHPSRLTGRLHGWSDGTRWTARAVATAENVARAIPTFDGTVRMAGRAQGRDTIASIRGHARALLGGASLASVRMDRAVAQAVVTGGRASLRSQIAIAGFTAAVSASTDLGTADTTLDVSAHGDLTRIPAAVGRSVAGRADLAARLSGPFDRLAGTVQVVGTDVRVAGRRLGRLALDARVQTRATDSIRVETIAVTTEAGRVTGLGAFASSGGYDAQFSASALSLATLCPLATTAACHGTAAVTGQLRGDAASRTVDIVVGARDVVIDENPIGRLEFAAKGPTTRLSIDGRITHPSAGSIELVGTIDSSRRVGAPLDIRVRTDAFDPSPLALVVREQVHRLAGALDSDLRIHGTLERPLVSGFAELRRGLIVLRESGVRFEPVRLRLDADGTSARVTLVRAVTDDGTMTGEGRIDFAAGGALDLTLRPARARIVRRAGMQASAAGELHLGGTIAAPVLSGRLELLDVVIRPAKLPLAQAVPTIDPTIEVAGRPDVPAASPPPAPTAPSALAVALDVHVARGTRVVRSDATLELDGDVHVAKVAGAGARLRGTLWLREGWLVFQDRRFWLTGGAVSFLDTDPPSAWVDAWAQHRAGEYVILVGLVGPIEKPDLRLVSDPPLGETDVLSVLLFGRPSGSLGANEVEGLRQLAVGLAADYAAPGLQRSVLDAFGIDTLTVDVPTGGTEAAGEVRIGRYVGEDLFLSLAQEFGAGVAQVVGAEYVLGAGVSVRVSASSTGRGAVDLLWSHRY